MLVQALIAKLAIEAFDVGVLLRRKPPLTSNVMLQMDDSWDVPDWPEPWEPEFEVPALRALAQAIQERSDAVVGVPDFSVEGCAFVQFYLGETNIGHACVGRHATGNPFYSAFFGATGDEFHGFNLLAIAKMATVYDTSIDEAPDLKR